jgi:hypothetical protein
MHLLAFVAQCIEQEPFRLTTPPPHRTIYEGSGGVVVGRAIGVLLTGSHLGTEASPIILELLGGR